MTYTIPPDSPRAVQAAAFGRELVKACQARGVPLKELERVCGVGHTALDNYRRGLSLPRTEAALAIAGALDWPQLRIMIERFRTHTCSRRGCARTFRNDEGRPKLYCSPICRRIAENERMAERRARQAGQTGSGKTRAAQVARLRSAVRIADDQRSVLEDAIAGQQARTTDDRSAAGRRAWETRRARAAEHEAIA